MEKLIFEMENLKVKNKKETVSKISNTYDKFHKLVTSIIGDEANYELIKDGELKLLVPYFYKEKKELKQFFEEKPVRVLDLTRVLMAGQLLDRFNNEKKYHSLRKLLPKESLAIIDATDISGVNLTKDEVNVYLKTLKYSDRLTHPTSIFLDKVFKQIL